MKNIQEKKKVFNKFTTGNYIKKHSFSTYARKSIKIYKRYILKKFLDKVIDILIYIFIVFVLSIIFIIYLLL